MCGAAKMPHIAYYRNCECLPLQCLYCCFWWNEAAHLMQTCKLMSEGMCNCGASVSEWESAEVAEGGRVTTDGCSCSVQMGRHSRSHGVLSRRSDWMES